MALQMTTKESSSRQSRNELDDVESKQREAFDRGLRVESFDLIVSSV
jgi:hypothetical protein